MTTAKVMDVNARLPDCDGQAADARSAYTQVKMEDAQKLLKIPKADCADMYGYVFRHINGRSNRNTLKILLCFLDETCTDTHSQDSCGLDSSKKH